MKTDYPESTTMNQMNIMYPGYETHSGYNTMMSAPSYENPSYMGYADPRFYRSQNGYPYNQPPIPSPYIPK